ncbi:multidrug ABC transporter substrate-binding protein [Candidatus Cerribacteria bacterium 'Amazon FNV 2010 28 9']|uniref:Multidrug ABC transporter substrate-binding protein n=1 Tax=Candidatus Cerribacteria bacterium 'Amazon FNV 2010 28 9' TaxID=2081795 RepID=A0A317JMQ7_9BACT|nr:MAG: multidrug ABC transporter substrate-binding protein [Candidatus Cerribacteria bacterium 'Amazon FNV 2010 28 9']
MSLTSQNTLSVLSLSEMDASKVILSATSKRKQNISKPKTNTHMDIVALVIEAFGTLTLNKLRTGLAILGIVIGIGSVIALISLGQGSQQSIQNQIQSLGANLLTVIPGGQSTGAVRGAAGSATTLTLDDAKAIQHSSQAPDVISISPEYSGRTQVVAGRNNTNTQIIGAWPQYAQIHKIDMAEGSFITQRDVDAMTKVAVLGSQAASNLFTDGSDPLGQTIHVKGQVLTVIGITVSKGGTGFNNADDAIYVPLSTAMEELFGSQHLSTLSLEAKNQDVMVNAENEAGFILLSQHKLSDPSQADFTIFSQQDILNTASQVTGTFTTLLGGIAAISLLVGGIGIMNIMLVTVTERTREIGLRKALGAKKKIIITQFLIESIILTLTGGIIGMMVGVGISFLLSRTMNIPFTISTSSILLAIGVSGAIGILFGWYPANQAANLQPIEALRYE